MSDTPQSPEAVTFQLAEKLLLSDGKNMIAKGNNSAATRQEIAAAYKETLNLVRNI